MVKISAGSIDVNKWLEGGYESGILSVVYGPPGSGKTNFCLQSAVAAARKGKKVIYVDTEGGFSVERIKQMSGEDTREVLENILLLSPTNFKEQKEAFLQLLSYLKQEVSLIVVDGLTMLYRLDFANAREKDIGEIQKVNSELVRQLRVLSEIARKQDLAVIVTNQTYSWDNEQKMVGGDILKYWAKCIIELTYERGKRMAHLRKHRHLPESEMQFTIVDEGVRKRGWL